MFGAGGGDALYTRGATLKIGGELFLVGYRLPSQGLDFSALMAMGPGALGGGPPGAKPKMPERKPVTPESELSVTLINLRAIGTISDIHPFDMAEAMKPPAPGLLDMMEKSKEKAQGSAASSNMKQIALAVMMYAQDYDQVLPPMADAEKFRKVILPYIKNHAVFTSPATGKPFRPNPRLSGRKLASLGNASSVVILYSGRPGAGRLAPHRLRRWVRARHHCG